MAATGDALAALREVYTLIVNKAVDVDNEYCNPEGTPSVYEAFESKMRLLDELRHEVHDMMFGEDESAETVEGE